MSEAANTLQSSATSRVVIAMAEGEIGGLVAAEKSIYFGDTPLMSEDGALNFQGVSFEMRPGAPDQAYLSGFPAVENDVNVEADVTRANAVTRRIDNASASAARVRIQLPQGLMNQDSGTGDLNATSVALAIEVRPNGGVFTRAVEDTITGKTTSAWEKTYRVELTGSAPWDLRVVRLTDDSSSAYLRNATRWASYTELVDRKCSYPYTALLAVAVDGKKFGSAVPAISADIYGKIIQVPSNYDPSTRAYTGIWDGTFKLAWSDNAAWCFYDLLRSSRYGLGIEDGGLKWSLYEIGRYCDELVPDGYGGTEPRFTCNLVLSTQEDAYQVISSMASIFRGMVYWASGSAACSQDRPMEPSHIVTPAKVVDGSLSYSGTDLSSRHTVALVTWNNPALGCKADIEVYEDAEGIRRYGWRQTDKISVGCTSRGQARRCGKWAIETELRETEILTFTGGLEYADAAPGDILKVLDPEVADVRHSGQIKAATASRLTLDAPVTIEAGQEYVLSVVLPDKSVVDAAVVAAPGQADTLDLAAPLAAAPLAGSAWALSCAEATARLFRVISNNETKPHLFEVVAVAHDPTKYARVERDLRFDAPLVSRVPTGPLAAPSGLAVHGFVYPQGGSPVAGALVSWSAPSDGRAATAEVEAARDGEAFARAGSTTEAAFDVRGLVAAGYRFRVRFVSRTGLTSPWAEVAAQISSTPPAPAAPSGVVVAITAAGVALSWDLDPLPWVTGYDIALDGELLVAGHAGSAYLIAPTAAGGRSVQLRARDVFGQVGEWSSPVVTPAAPAPPVVTASILGWNIKYDIAAAARAAFAVVGHLLREGEAWDTGVDLGTITGTTHIIIAGAAGTVRRWFAAVDSAGNVGTPTSVDVTITAPQAPGVTAGISGGNIEVRWEHRLGSLPLAASEILHGETLDTATSLGSGLANTSMQVPGAAGVHRFWVRDVDVAGNVGPAGMVELVITAPGAVSISPQVVDNNVLLAWTENPGTLPVADCELRRGATYPTSTPIGRISGRFSTIFESVAGSYTYWITQRDVAGNDGTSASITVQVGQPPDYVLHADMASAFGGELTNALLERGALLLPVDTASTVADRMASGGWASRQAKADAGYPYRLEPTPAGATYLEVIDYGTILAGAKITVTQTSQPIHGSVALGCNLQVRASASDPWTDLGDVWSAYGTAFRYLQVTITATPDGGSNDLLRLTELRIRLDVKLKNDAGSAACNAGDSGGTQVNFNVSFVDVQSITLTPAAGGAARYALYDFTDTPNPTGFKILLYDAAGNRVSGTCSWSVKGV